MGTKTLIPEAEYLHLSFDGPEPDYVDGELVERPMPAYSHSASTTNLILAVAAQDSTRRLHLCPEIRVRTAPSQYRVVDLAIFDTKPSAEIPPEIPLAAIEILSVDNSHAELMRKFDEFERLGVEHIWLVDPLARRFAVYRAASLTDARELTIPAHQVTIRLADIFHA
jgi:Uma2 family endonuclease